jgi:hypothetical protein
MKKRKPKRDDPVDRTRTIFWFSLLREYFGTEEPRDIQRGLAPQTCGLDTNGDLIRNNKFLGYSLGEHVPQARLISEAQRKVPRSEWVINHPIWSILRAQGSVQNAARGWLKQLAPDIECICMQSDGNVAVGPNRHVSGSLERRAGLDSLAALTILLRLSIEQKEQEWAWEYAQSTFRTLLVMGNELDKMGVAERIFQLYAQRIFSLVEFEGKRLAPEDYDFVNRAWLLDKLAEDIRENYLQHGEQRKRERRMPSFYALQALTGNRHLRFRHLFQLPVVHDYDDLTG